MLFGLVCVNISRSMWSPPRVNKKKRKMFYVEVLARPRWRIAERPTNMYHEAASILNKNGRCTRKPTELRRCTCLKRYIVDSGNLCTSNRLQQHFVEVLQSSWGKSKLGNFRQKPWRTRNYHGVSNLTGSHPAP